MKATAMRRFGRVLCDIWPSLVATLLATVGAFLSMGLLGLALYHLVSPVLSGWFPPLAAWDQSLVWPVILVMPVVWSPAFVVAGFANRHARNYGWGRRRRIPLYVAVVWLAALAVWSAILMANPDLWR